MYRLVLTLGVAFICFGAAHAAAGDAQRTPPTAATGSSEVVNLNSATVAQLADLPGIGMKTAELIVQYRGKNGPFKKIEELMNIRGIGEKSFLRIKDRVTVAAPKGEGTR